MKNLYPLVIGIVVFLHGFLLIPLANAGENNLYQIEIIVFENRQLTQADMERWPTHPALPETKDSIKLLNSEGPQLAPFKILSADHLSMLSEAARIARDPNYQLLLHIAWLQPITLELSPAIHLYAKDDVQDIHQLEPYSQEIPWKLDGVISLRKSKYYEIKTDLALNKTKPLDVNKIFTSGVDNKQQTFIYRMVENRRMRDKELHYLDNPVFGLLIKITPTPSVVVKEEHPLPNPLPEGEGT